MPSRKERETFGRFVADNRRRTELSQTEAAHAVGLSRTTWARIESGESGTKREKIPAIAKVINADLLETYDLAGYKAPAHLAVDCVHDDQFIQSWCYRLHKKFVRLTQIRRIALLPILEMVEHEIDRELDQLTRAVILLFVFLADILAHLLPPPPTF